MSAFEERQVLWHTLWSETYSNPRYAELVPRLRELFFAPIRQRPGFLGRLDGGMARRTPFVERRTLAWYWSRGIRLLLTPSPTQAPLFSGPVVVDLDDPVRTSAEQAALRASNIRHVVAPTSAIAQYVRESNPDTDITVVSQGVDVERASRADNARVRANLLGGLNLPYETVIVGYHAPVIALSGDPEIRVGQETFYVDVLIGSVQRLWRDGFPFVTVLVGKTSATIKELARHEPRLVLKDYVDRAQLFDWVGTFDIGAYPRTVDFGGRQSVKLLEYMISGAAIVAMITSESRVVNDRLVGYTASNAEEYYDKLRTLICDREARCVFGERGRCVAKDFDWRVLAARYDVVLSDAAKTA